MIVAQDDKNAISKIFGDCWCESFSILSGSCRKAGFVNKISPDSIGDETAAYYYYRGLCMARWGKVQGLPTQIRMISKLDATITKGLTTDNDFQGGAMNRLGAGVYSNAAVKPLGYYDIAKATSMVKGAMSSSDGYDYLDNWSGAITVWEARHVEEPNGGWIDKAIEFASEALEMADELIEDDEIPADRKPEFLWYYNEIKIQYKSLTGDDWEA